MKITNRIPALLMLAALLPLAAQTTPSASVSAPAAGQKLPISPLGVEVVYMTQFHGPQPQAIKRPTGPFLLVIVNRTTNPTLNLSVTPATPGAAAAAAGILEGKSQQFVLDLPAGKYTIAESSRSDWSIDLEVE